MNVEKALKDNGYNYARKSRDEIIFTPNLKFHRGFGYLILSIGIYRCFTSNKWFAVIPIIAGLYFIMEPETKQHRAVNINDSVHLTPGGFEIRSKKGRRYYSTHEFGDLKVNRIIFENMEAVTLATKLSSTGEEIIIMRAINSDKKETLKVFNAIANRMIDCWT